MKSRTTNRQRLAVARTRTAPAAGVKVRVEGVQGAFQGCVEKLRRQNRAAGQ